VIIERIPSQALAQNPLGDPATRSTPVILPPDYATQPERRYPVVMVLAGFSGRGLGMLNDDLWEETMAQRVMRLMTGGIIRPMIFVLPDGSTRYGGSQYRNSSATGRYEDHLLEVVAYIDQRYRTLPDRHYRAIAGISSGGYGAMWMGMRHPDVFGLVVDHSGDKYFDWCYRPDFAGLLRLAQKDGLEGIQRLLANPAAVRPKSGDFFQALNCLAMASCYSPNPKAELGFDLPVDLDTGEFDAEVWDRWLACDPVNLVGTYSGALKSLRLLYFECGTRDEYNLLYGGRVFNRRLTAAGIPHQYAEFDDGHRSLRYRYDTSLALISQAMP